MGQEELSILKRRQNVSRSLSFSLSSIRDIKQSLELEDCCLENATDMVDQHEDNMPDYESKGIRMSHKQVYMGRLGYVNEGQCNDNLCMKDEPTFLLFSCIVASRYIELRPSFTFCKSFWSKFV